MDLAKTSVLHLDAGHTVNGNPRRLYLLCHPTGIVGIVNENYRGSDALDEFGEAAGKQLRKQIVAKIKITPGEYQTLKRHKLTKHA